LALRIPKAVAEDTGLQQGSEVDISLEDGQIVVSPVQRPAFSLEDLLSRVTPKNRHGMLDSGSPRGNEVW
jgi:antitoxin MazE